MKPIQINDYNSDWSCWFQQEKSLLQRIFGEYLIRIEHVGSTAIPGLAAKPVIDIMVAVDDLADIAYIEPPLVKEGYQRRETGMPGRVFFQKVGHETSYHLQIMPREGFDERNELLFRDYLKKSPELIEEYGRLKRELAKTMGSDNMGYTRGKTEFIQHVVDLARDEKNLPRQAVWEE